MPYMLCFSDKLFVVSPAISLIPLYAKARTIGLVQYNSRLKRQRNYGCHIPHDTQNICFAAVVAAVRLNHMGCCTVELA
jgi:hypothetical protein